MSDLYGYFVNESLEEGPKPLPKNWVLPTGETVLGFNKLADTDPAKLIEFNWYKVDKSCIDVPCNEDYEKIVYSGWTVENNILTRKWVKIEHSFSYALTIAFKKLETNRRRYEEGGVVYDYQGIPVIISTDRASSQPKILAARSAVKDQLRKDVDVWKFEKLENKESLVVQLSNDEVLAISDLVYRTIQDSYNLQSQIAWQMLGAGGTATLKEQIENGTINLDPWKKDDTPWQLQ